ncbi:MAG TPA: hypothetical protein VGJ39_14105 [Vicinamibacterales bacterium]|jgi:hypothetical protein
MIFVVLAVATLFAAWSAPGWPANHEDNSFAVRTLIYARHFSWLDFIPVWSSADSSGFGSPMPLMYHKLFYVLAGALALATGSVKSANVIAVGLLLVAGASGIYLTVRTLGGSRLAATVAGCSLITANYTVTNWLVRGAMAEFCGAMMIPWVLLFFVRTIQSGRLAIGLGVSFGLLWLSHSVLAYYTGLILGSTYLLLLLMRLAPVSAIDPRTAWPSGVWFAVLVGPYLVLMAIVGREYDFSRILTPPFRPIYQFKPPSAYLWDRQWRFGGTASGLTVQLDHAVLLLMAIGLGALAIRKPSDDTGTRWRAVQPALPFLVILALGSFLQLPVAAPFYEWVPGAQFIQFPWRVLAIMTPALIVAAVYLADRALPPDGRHFILGGAMIWMVVSCGSFAPLRDPRIRLDPPLTHLTFSGFREYEPRQAAPLAEIQTKLSARWKEAGCSYETANPDNDEVSTARFHTLCGQSAVLPLPLYASAAHVVMTSNQPRGEPCMLLPDFPGVCGAVIPAAEDTVAVKLPNVASVVGSVWRRYGRR